MLNQVNFIGNIGRIETKTIGQDKTVCNFSLAVTSKSKAGEETLWFEVSAWDKLAVTCGNYLSKGKKVFVSGKLGTRVYDNKEGAKVTKLEVQANQVVFLSPKTEATLADQNHDDLSSVF